jgi:hypothetical protein
VTARRASPPADRDRSSANFNGTTNVLVKFTSATTGGNSSVTDDGTTLTSTDQVDVTGELVRDGPRRRVFQLRRRPFRGAGATRRQPRQ